MSHTVHGVMLVTGTPIDTQSFGASGEGDVDIFPQSWLGEWYQKPLSKEASAQYDAVLKEKGLLWPIRHFKHAAFTARRVRPSDILACSSAGYCFVIFAATSVCSRIKMRTAQRSTAAARYTLTSLCVDMCPPPLHPPSDIMHDVCTAACWGKTGIRLLQGSPDSAPNRP